MNTKTIQTQDLTRLSRSINQKRKQHHHRSEELIGNTTKSQWIWNMFYFPWPVCSYWTRLLVRRRYPEVRFLQWKQSLQVVEMHWKQLNLLLMRLKLRSKNHQVNNIRFYHISVIIREVYCFQVCEFLKSNYKIIIVKLYISR